MAAEQKKVVYSNGYALEMPNREQAREEFSREEIEKFYDQKIAREAKQWGENYIYTKWARESKVKNMEQYDEGKVVAVYSKAEFGFNNNAEKFRQSYDTLKMRLALSGEYNTAPQVSETDTDSGESEV